MNDFKRPVLAHTMNHIAVSKDTAAKIKAHPAFSAALIQEHEWFHTNSDCLDGWVLSVTPVMYAKIAEFCADGASIHEAVRRALASWA
jgi:hypothetical protein